MKEIGHWINGKIVKGMSGRFADVMNPATGEVQAKVALATKAELDAAAADAAKAQVKWGATNPQRRARVMMEFVRLLNRDMQKLAEALSSEHGKTVPDAKGDIQRGLEVIEFCIGGPFRLYRWANENAAPTVAYIGDPSDTDTNLNHRRFGDSLAVRGSGSNTELLAGTRAGKVVARFSTSDGYSFQHQKLEAPDLQGISAMVTIAFGTGNTFWAKVENSATTNQPLQHFSYDTGAGTATLIQNHLNIPGGPLNFDASRNLLGVVRGMGHEFRLFRLTANGFVQQDATIPFPGTHSNGNLTGAVAFSPDAVFALESNNGLMAFSLSTNTLAPFPVEITAPAGQPTLTWPSTAGFLYQPQYKHSLADANWSDLNGATNGTGADISVVDPFPANMQFYRVRAD